MRKKEEKKENGRKISPQRVLSSAIEPLLYSLKVDNTHSLIPPIHISFYLYMLLL
jgi:hypothetical protein